VHLERLWLTDFRSYLSAEFEPASTGITVVTGSNGEGKTNLIEAVGYLATLRSLRGSPTAALIRDGAPGGRGVVRASCNREGRTLLIEAEIHASGRDRVQINGQPLRRARDLLGALQVSVFSPDDLVLVKGGPQPRRGYLDDLLVALHPRHDLTIAEVERVLKQRNALLKSASSWRRGELPEDVRVTLDVWDAKLAEAGQELAVARSALAVALEPLVSKGYAHLAVGLSRSGRDRVTLQYKQSWEGGLAEALGEARETDLRRGVTTVGPHRDELEMSIGSLPARTHASQGEQRCLALAMRLSGHQLVDDRIGTPPVLLLDDVFSELDPVRSEALITCLPDGQAVVTTAGHLPASAKISARVRIEDGKLVP
jgi:DNA replication and repair protein RecF